MAHNQAGTADRVGNFSTWTEYLQAHMDQRGWTRSDLAREANLDRSVVTRWFREDAQPSIDSARRCADALRRDIREGLIVANLLTSAELNYYPSSYEDEEGESEQQERVVTPPSLDIRHFTDDQVVADLRRRLAQPRGRGPARRQTAPVAHDSVQTREQLGIDSLELNFRPPAGPLDELASRREDLG